MELATHTALVEEILAAVERGDVMNPRAPVSDANALVIDDFDEAKREKLPPAYADAREDIAADLQHCAMNRALHGLVPDSFWERVWEIYRQGAWPCGWEGEYPQGRIVIFQPPVGVRA
jgi:hypothetical protein